MEKKTLVQVALERSKPSQELFDLAVAFFSGQITSGDACRAIGMKERGTGRIIGRLSSALRNGIKCGMGKIVVSVEK